MIACHVDMAGLGLKKVLGSFPGGKYRPFPQCSVPGSFGSGGRRDGEALSSRSRRRWWVWVVLWMSAMVVGVSEGWSPCATQKCTAWPARGLCEREIADAAVPKPAPL